MKHKTSSNQPGFTIVELLVVIVVIGILAAVTIVAYTGISQKAVVATLQSDLKNSSTVLELDYTTTGVYPATKELANEGSGLKSSSGVTFQYSSSGSGYCLTALHDSGLSYFIDSMSKIPTAGKCPVSFAVAWGGTGNDMGYSLVQTSDGGYAVTGNTASYGAGNTDMFLAKYDSSGNISWNKTWGGTGADSGSTIVQTSDGGYTIAGTTFGFGAGSWEMFLAKYDSNGTLSWNKTSGGTGMEFLQSMIHTSDSGYAVVGSTYTYGAGNSDIFLVKYDSSGNISWSKTWGGTDNDSGYSIIQTTDGGYAITGYTYTYGAGVSDMFLVKYDSSGNISWNKTWGDTGSNDGYSLIQTTDGGYALTGSGTGSELLLVKYDSSGTLSWNKTFGGASSDVGRSVIQTTDGGYTIAGSTVNYGAGSFDVLLVKYKSEGLISGCVSPMCKTPSATVTSPSVSVSTPSATVTSPSVSVSTPSATVTSPSATSTVIIAP